MTEMPNNLSDEIDRRIRAGWVGFKRYKRELYDFQKASLLPLEARMARSEVVEALLYGWMRDMDPPEVPLRQAPYNAPQNVASSSRSLVQIAEQATLLFLFLSLRRFCLFVFFFCSHWSLVL